MQRGGRGGNRRGRRGRRGGALQQKTSASSVSRATIFKGPRGRGRSLSRFQSSRPRTFRGKSTGIVKPFRGRGNRRSRGRGRGGTITRPTSKTGAQLDNELDEYFKEDPSYVAKKLDDELDDYMSHMPNEQQDATTN
eukprot:g2158.t1